MKGVFYGKEPDTESIFIIKDDLVLIHKEIVQFEKELPIQDEIKPSYLDPDHKFYSVTLDLGVRA